MATAQQRHTSQRREPLTADTTKYLPQNVEAEAALLGALIIDSEAYRQCYGKVAPEDFYRESHRQIFQAIADLHAAHREADLVTLCDALTRRGHLDDMGGSSYLTTLTLQVPTTRNVAHYAEIIEQCATLRRIIQAAGHIAGLAYNTEGSDLDDVVQQAHQALLAATTRRETRDSITVAQAVDEFWSEQLDALEHGGFTGMRTGIGALDEHIQGLAKAELGVIMGRPGSGKSTVAAEIAQNGAMACRAAGEGCVEWLTFEMSRTQIIKRMLAGYIGIDGRIMRNGYRRPDGSFDRDAFERVQRGKSELADLYDHWLRIQDTPTTMDTIEQHITRSVLQRGCKLVIVDYIGLIPHDPEQMRVSLFERITNLSNRLRTLAQTLRIPIWVLTQMSREVEKRQNKRPEMGDGKGSGDIEQDASIILGVYRGAVYSPKFAREDPDFAAFMELGILKMRDGMGGVTVPVRVELAQTRISPWVGPYEQYRTMTGSEA